MAGGGNVPTKPKSRKRKITNRDKKSGQFIKK